MENEYKKKYLKYKKLYFNLLNNLGNDLVKSKSLQIGGAAIPSVAPPLSQPLPVPSLHWGFVSLYTLATINQNKFYDFETGQVLYHTRPYSYVLTTSQDREIFKNKDGTKINFNQLPIWLGKITREKIEYYGGYGSIMRLIFENENVVHGGFMPKSYMTTEQPFLRDINLLWYNHNVYPNFKLIPNVFIYDE